MLKGHLFLLHADLADVAYDAIVLPTDSTFSVREEWKELGVDTSKPVRFDEQHFGRTGRTWWVDVTDGGRSDADALVAHLSSLTEDAS